MDTHSKQPESSSVTHEEEEETQHDMSKLQSATKLSKTFQSHLTR